MNRALGKNLRRSRWLLGLLVICLIFCITSNVFAATTNVYRGLNMQLPFITGAYQLSLGPFQVDTYSTIRVYTFGNSGSGIIHVTLANVTTSGENLGLLDDYDLDFASAYYHTQSYDCPGRFLKVYLQSLNPCYASVVIYGMP